MTPEEMKRESSGQGTDPKDPFLKKVKKLTPQEMVNLAKSLFGIDIPLFALPVALPPAEDNTIDTIIVIAPPEEIFLHFAESCRANGWTRPNGRLNGDHVRASQHVKNYVDNYVICVARRE